ncbi:hypothetical protein [Leptolyngbya sp. Cla-17]|nr:hypothetical protein [Leptolyngbya sp. Cla-17]
MQTLLVKQTVVYFTINGSNQRQRATLVIQPTAFFRPLHLSC